MSYQEFQVIWRWSDSLGFLWWKVSDGECTSFFKPGSVPWRCEPLQVPPLVFLSCSCKTPPTHSPSQSFRSLNQSFSPTPLYFLGSVSSHFQDSQSAASAFCSRTQLDSTCSLGFSPGLNSNSFILSPSMNAGSKMSQASPSSYHYRYLRVSSESSFQRCSLMTKAPWFHLISFLLEILLNEC